MQRVATPPAIKERADIAAVLLIVEASLNIFAWVLALDFGAGHGLVIVVTGLMAIGGIVTAAGLARLRPWARRLAIVLQWLTILNGLTPALIPHPGSGFDLLAIITNIGLPLLVLVLLRRQYWENGS